LRHSLSSNESGAHEREVLPSCKSGIHERHLLPDLSRKSLAFAFAAAAILTGVGCGSDSPQPPAETAAKTAEPAIPEDVQSAASKFLGKETTVLAFGDLAKTGNRQLLAANLVPKTPKDTVAGTIATRIVLAEESEGSWHELVRCDEHLKNEKGYLGGSPIESVSGWKVQFEKNDTLGLTLYLIPIKGTLDPHVLPLAIRWNSAVKRYQTLDRNYEHFLSEAASLGTTRSHL